MQTWPQLSVLLLLTPRAVSLSSLCQQHGACTALHQCHDRSTHRVKNPLVFAGPKKNCSAGGQANVQSPLFIPYQHMSSTCNWHMQHRSAARGACQAGHPEKSISKICGVGKWLWGASGLHDPWAAEFTMMTREGQLLEDY